MPAASSRASLFGDRRAVVDDSIAAHLPFHVHDRSPGNSVTNPSLYRVDEDSIDAFFALSSADAGGCLEAPRRPSEPEPALLLVPSENARRSPLGRGFSFQGDARAAVISFSLFVSSPISSWSSVVRLTIRARDDGARAALSHDILADTCGPHGPSRLGALRGDSVAVGEPSGSHVHDEPPQPFGTLPTSTESILELGQARAYDGDVTSVELATRGSTSVAESSVDASPLPQVAPTIDSFGVAGSRTDQDRDAPPDSSKPEAFDEECAQCTPPSGQPPPPPPAWRKPRIPRHRAVQISHAGWSQARCGAASFLIYLIRRIREARPGGWRPGQPLPSFFRQVSHPRCGGGAFLATADEFGAQRDRAELRLDWLREHVQLLRRLRSGSTPSIGDLYCCSGGQSDGVRRMGGSVAFGVDRVEQPSYVLRFGAETFHVGDALDRNLIRSLVRRFRPIGIFASPPCQGSSTATFGNAPSSAPHLISQTRDLLRELGVPFIIEK
jgi:hypothetical protein